MQVLVHARLGGAETAVYCRRTHIVSSPPLSVIVMGDFNKDTLRNPKLSELVHE